LLIFSLKQSHSMVMVYRQIPLDGLVMKRALHLIQIGQQV
jgi:hypothetical protein